MVITGSKNFTLSAIAKHIWNKFYSLLSWEKSLNKEKTKKQKKKTKSWLNFKTLYTVMIAQLLGWKW